MCTSYCKVKFAAPAVLLPFLLIIGMTACNQDSIFDDISKEVPPTDPLIEGAPSKIIKAAYTAPPLEKLYVTNGRIYEFDLAGNGRWKRTGNSPSGSVRNLAFTTENGGTLYAMSHTGTGIGSAVWKKTGDGSWEQLGIDSTDTGGYTVIQSIFGAGDRLFAGASRSNGGGGNDYAILYAAENKLVLLSTETKGVLSGAGVLGDVYYLATMGSGILRAPSDLSGAEPAPVTSGPAIPDRIAGFLQPDPGYIIAASRNGNILYGTSAGFTVPATSLGGTFTGALALTRAYNYEADPPESVAGVDLLLIGVQGGNSSYNHGYLETVFDRSTGVTGVSRLPGNEDQPTSIAKNGNYGSTLRRYPVTSIFALEHISGDPRSAPIMFASTPNNGFYSYRNRSSGGWQWNHEE